MRTKAKREVEIIICDFCGEEVDSVDRCAVCKREGCSKKGEADHFAYSVDIGRLSDNACLLSADSRVCKECAEKNPGLTIKELFDSMIDKRTSLIKE